MSANWPWICLDELLRLERRPVEVVPDQQYQEIGIYCFGKGIFHKTPRSGLEVGDKNLYQVREGDLILQVTFAWEGAIALCSKAEDGLYGSSRYPTFRVNEELCFAPFLARYLVTRESLEQINKICPGSAGRNRVLSIKRIHEVEIPLPPLPEQRCIVARIDELAAKIEEARGLRQQAVKEVKVFFAGAKHEVFSKGPTNSWTVKKLDDAAPINMGQSPPGESYNDIGEGIPLLNGPTEFGDRHPKAAQWTTVPTKLCKRGDILLCVRGATTGRMNWADREYCIGRGLAALTPDPDFCVPEYVYHFVDTQTQEMLALSAGSTFPNLSGEKLKTLPIPLPSVPEQRRIVSYLDSLQAKVDALKHLQAETAAELDAMLPSILDRAFKGEL